MMPPVPFRDENNRGTLKRTYWPKGDANAAFQEVRKSVGGLTSKRGKQYSRDDQRKIAREKWAEFCESKPEWRKPKEG